eukprot:6194926-Pleurochrysis_carterae.AAC.4
MGAAATTTAFAAAAALRNVSKVATDDMPSYTSKPLVRNLLVARQLHRHQFSLPSKEGGHPPCRQP